MNWIVNHWNANPVRILAILNAGLALAMGFGAHLSTEQQALILAFASAVLGEVGRSQVTPTKGTGS